jgi:hypothetical protein
MTVQKDLNAGDEVRVRGHTSRPGEGLSYPEFVGVIQDDAGSSEGWDVVNVRETMTGDIISIYCFSIQRNYVMTDKIKYYVVLSPELSAADRVKMIDEILRKFRPEDHKDNEDHNPLHLHVNPNEFYQSDFGSNYEKPGDPVQWAMRQLLWHLSGRGTICQRINNGFVEHSSSTVEIYSIPRIGYGGTIHEYYDSEDIQLIFIHRSQMSLHQLRSFIFLLESLHYREFVL